MTIDPDVQKIARHWGLDPALIQAVVNAEGNILKAVQCSLPSVDTREEAIEVTCRSAVHAMCDYLLDQRVGFVAFWGKRWAPVGAENDPTNLNSHWVRNVTRLWLSA